MDYEIDERWLEMDYGDLDGLPVADVPRRHVGAVAHRSGLRPPVARRAWRDGHPCCRCHRRPAGAAAVDQMVVVTTHVSPIKAAMAWALGVDLTITWRSQIDQASV